MKPPADPRYRHRLPAEIISPAGWLYHVLYYSPMTPAHEGGGLPNQSRLPMQRAGIVVRGRDPTAEFLAQIRASGIPAHGSYLRASAENPTLGQGCQDSWLREKRVGQLRHPLPHHVDATHDAGSMWIATSSPWWSCTTSFAAHTSRLMPYLGAADQFPDACADHQADAPPLDQPSPAAQPLELAGGRIPVMVCFERARGPKWCLRSLVGAWLGGRHRLRR
jgi:hypothetical protein